MLSRSVCRPLAGWSRLSGASRARWSKGVSLLRAAPVTQRQQTPAIACRWNHSEPTVGSAARKKREQEAALEAKRRENEDDDEEEGGQISDDDDGDLEEGAGLEITDSYRFIHGETAANEYDSRGRKREPLLTTKGLRDWMRANSVAGDKAVPVLEFLQKQRVAFSRGIAHILLEEYSARKDTETIDVLLARLTQESLVPSYRTYRILVEHFCNVVKDEERAFALLEEMKERKDVSPDFEIYNSFLDMHAARGEIKKVKKIIAHLHDEETFTFEQHMVRLKNHYKKQYDYPSAKAKLPKRLRFTEEFLPKEEAEDAFLRDSNVILYKEEESSADPLF